MCGIAGLYSPDAPHRRDRLRALRDRLRHRGPDDAGEACWDAEAQPISSPEQPAAFALLHRRLSILDLSPAGHQPMASADGAGWIAFNGEIYNFATLKAGLQAEGAAFRSHSDTEVLLELIRRRGFAEAIRAAEGMFAVAYFEPATRRLMLARDRLGKKPLFVARHPGQPGAFAFASEIKALVEWCGGLSSLVIDPEQFDRYWTTGATAAGKSIYAQIDAVPPATIRVIEPGGVREETYWSCPMARGVEPAPRSLDEAADELEVLLGDAVRKRLVADVPVGLFLSGGVDSALVCALAARAGAASLHAYTVGFRDAASDESQAAAAIARHLGLPHAVLPVDETAAPDFEAIAGRFDQPFGDVSCIPTYFLCRAARQRVVVALTGDGGDEGFAGYDDYREGLRLWGPPAIRRALRVSRGPAAWIKDLALRGLGPARGFPLKFRHFGPRQKKRFYAPDALARVRAATDGHHRRVAGLRGDPAAVMQAIDIATYLPDDILVKMDRMSMAVSLEARSPLLDHRVIEFAAGLPFEHRVDERGRGKRVLRHLLARHVPRELWDRPKRGFTPPWPAWCAALKPELRRRWRALSGGWVDPGAADFAFPETERDSPLLTWNFYSWLVFEESRR